MKQARLKKWLPLAPLPLIAAACLWLWFVLGALPHTQVQGQRGTWDLRGFGFSADSALIVGEVEYIPDALLSPEKFEARAGEIRVGNPQDTTRAATSRVRILVPQGDGVPTPEDIKARANEFSPQAGSYVYDGTPSSDLPIFADLATTYTLYACAENAEHTTNGVVLLGTITTPTMP